MCGGTTTLRALPDFVVSIRQVPRCVTARATEMDSQPAEMSDRLSSMTSPQRNPHHEAISTRAQKRSDLVVLDRAVADLHPVAEAAARGVDQPVAISLALGVGGLKRRLAEVCAELVHRLAHRLEHPYSAVKPRELPQPRVRSLRLEKRGDERIAADDQVGQRSELHDTIVVAGGLGVAVLRPAGAARRHGPAVPGMAGAAGIHVPGVADVLADLPLAEGLNPLALAVVEP